MDNLRGDGSGKEFRFDAYGSAPIEDEPGREPPPTAIGQAERRMQLRAYSSWTGMLGDRRFPAIDSLISSDLADFGDHGVLLDFTGDVRDPAIRQLGAKLGAECGIDHRIARLDDVPARSLLTQITDHYPQILANQAPIGFEAEFINQRGAAILYRGILLPFSSNDATIDFLYGVINWKELADQHTAGELLLEISQAIEPGPVRRNGPRTEWADWPFDGNDVLDLVTRLTPEVGPQPMPTPSFGRISPGQPHDDRPDPIDIGAPIGGDIPNAMGLADWLAAARQLAQAARGSDDRSRQALYAALGRAYDFSIAAATAPHEFAKLVAAAGLTLQHRAPLTPLVKLVFGADYDKTRLAEYAAALDHAHRLDLDRGALAAFLAEAPGGLKGVVQTERRLRRADPGQAPAPCPSPRLAPSKTLARKLRQIDPRPIGGVAGDGSEFTLLVARRLADGTVVLLGEIADDIPLLERAARRLVD